MQASMASRRFELKICNGKAMTPEKWEMETRVGVGIISMIVAKPGTQGNGRKGISKLKRHTPKLGSRNRARELHRTQRTDAKDKSRL